MAFQHSGSARLFLMLVILIVAPAFARAADAPLNIMTFNLRYASATGENAWPVRRPVMKELIRSVMPDIIGTQEGLYHQLRDLASDLPEYQWIGLGREGGSRGEFMAVFYRKDRLDPIEFDHYWLSDTPNVMGSTTWGNKIMRMVTQVTFKDLKTGTEFYLINTHFDHQVQASREKSAALVRQRIDKLGTALPIIVTGDFNAVAGKNKAYEILTEGDFLQDTWKTAKEHKGQTVNTFHGYKTPGTQGNRIDWILTRGDVTCDSIQILTFSKDGQYPSDHFPVMATLELPAKKPVQLPAAAGAAR